MRVSDTSKNRGAHGDSSFKLGGVPSSSENPPTLAVGSVKWKTGATPMYYHYTIPTTPRTKKNSQQIAFNQKTGKPFIIQSEQYTNFEMIAGYFLKPKPKQPIDYPVTVRCIFYMPTRRKVDKANLEAAIHDILVKYKILEDDNRDIIASTDGTRVYYDTNRPRADIYIEPYEGEYEDWKK